MTKILPRIAVAQLHTIAGDITGNTAKILHAAEQAAEQDIEILVTQEQGLSGYPIEDLAGDLAFLKDVEKEFFSLIEKLPSGLAVTIGLPMLITTYDKLYRTTYGQEQPEDKYDDGPLDASNRLLHNVLALVKDGKILAIRAKVLLPTYGLFDDARWMEQGELEQQPIDFNGTQVALAICEDVWTDEVALDAASAGADLLLVANASPYENGKNLRRLDMLSALAKKADLTIVYANAVGGQDEIVYDGGSFIVTPDGFTPLIAPLFSEGIWYAGQTGHDSVKVWPADDNDSIWQALTTGLRDYVRDNGFTSVLIGLSGGIDSAVAAAIAVDALGPENVWGIGLPGPYSSQGSIDDAVELAERLRIRFDLIPIGDTVHAENSIMKEYVDNSPNPGIAYENIQARTRALHLMTLANSHNMMMLNTGNKSEAAVGYFTLGGDSSGGFAILKDVYKMRVFQLAEWRNLTALMDTGEIVIPISTITKPPSAELAADQQDTDSLPPYPVLDFILYEYLEERKAATLIAADLIAAGVVSDMTEETVNATVLRVLSMVDRAEHKRRQTAPSCKISSRSFGRERRLPITAKRQHHL